MRASLLLFLLSISICEAAKFPLVEERREFFVLHSPGDASGMFSVFLTALGFLDLYEKSNWAGIELDFEEKGLYFDEKREPNWWNYYFEPLKLGDRGGATVKTVRHKLIHKSNKFATRTMSRERGYALIQKYIKIQPEIAKKVEHFAKRHFEGNLIIGVHYRGTDKKREAKRVPYGEVIAEVRRQAEARGGMGYKIFVATDEEAFLKEITAEFKEKIVYIEAQRSNDGKAVHFAKKDQYEIGGQALMDCLLLSRTHFLVRTPSNLSYSVEFFNPSLPVALVTKGAR